MHLFYFPNRIHASLGRRTQHSAAMEKKKKKMSVLMWPAGAQARGECWHL
jgi:hypothetical protein